MIQYDSNVNNDPGPRGGTRLLEARDAASANGSEETSDEIQTGNDRVANRVVERQQQGIYPAGGHRAGSDERDYRNHNQPGVQPAAS